MERYTSERSSERTRARDVRVADKGGRVELHFAMARMFTDRTSLVNWNSGIRAKRMRAYIHTRADEQCPMYKRREQRVRVYSTVNKTLYSVRERERKKEKRSNLEAFITNDCISSNTGNLIVHYHIDPLYETTFRFSCIAITISTNIR